MSYTITVETHDTEAKVLYWNRRKAVWQKHLSKSCIYPTFKGSWRVFKRVAHVNWPYIDGRPVRAVRHKPA